MVFIPLLLLTILNGYIYHVLAKSSRRSIRQKSRPSRDKEIATVLVTIVIVFASCNIPRVFINIFEVRPGD